jgi:phage gp29-like protein
LAAKKKTPKQAADNGRAGVEPTVRTFTTWTPALVRSAELQADGGNLRLAANLCDWILSDDRVQGTLQTRVQALLGLEPTFEASGDKRRSSRVVKALEAGEDWWESYPEHELGLMLTWGIMLNVAPMRHNPVIDDDHGGRMLPKPEFWHPQHLRQDNATREWKIRVQSGPNGATHEEVLTPGDGTWILHTPYGPNRPWSQGLWRGLSRWVLLKYLAMQDWARHSENAGELVVTSDKEVESSLKQRKELADDIYQRGREAVVVLPPGFSMDLISAVANSHQIYQAQIEMANTAIAITVRGGNATTELKEGSLAGTEAQERLGDHAKLEFDAQSLTTTIHDQSLVYWAEWNYGNRALAPWTVYPTKPKRDLGRRADATAKAVKAAQGVMSLGCIVEQEAFIEEWELGSWVKPSEVGALLSLPAPPVPPSPPATKAADPETAGDDPDDAEDADEPDDDESESN